MTSPVGPSRFASSRGRFSRGRAAFVARWFAPLAIALAVPLAARAQDPAATPAGDGPKLSQVVLFSSGVGFYEHEGEVQDNARLELKFEAEDVNDLLKSMVLQDLDGGKVASVGYGSREPISRLLGSFAVDLTQNPSLADLLRQLRGEKIEIESPKPTTGVIVGVEVQSIRVEDRVVDTEMLTILSAGGLRRVPLEQVSKLRLLNEKLDDELRQALSVLATAKRTETKTIAIEFLGKGKRRVRVGYVQESPIWKTSYRLVLSKDAPPLLQGWAIVENTTENDWKDVGLTLVSGRPISFKMDLYQPLFIQRPLVQMELYASLRPQTYDQDLQRAADEFAAKRLEETEGLARSLREAESRKDTERSYAARAGAAKPGDTTLGRRMNANELRDSVASVAQAGDVGELFEYVVETPVSIARRQSAMLPIVSGSVEGEKVSIYNAGVHAKHPLNGLQMKNSTGLHLLQGPVTVYDEGVYAGDARIMDLSPGTTRLISYAMDLDTEVAVEDKGTPEELVSVRIVHGNLYATRHYRRTKVYTVKNSDKADKKVLIEHPKQGGWNLVEPKNPAENTRDMYRFAVTAKPGAAVSLTTVEETRSENAWRLTNLDDDSIRFYLNASIVGQKVKDALVEIVKQKNAIQQVVAERQRREGEIAVVAQEQERIRQNMAQLPRSGDLYARYVKKFGEQEDLVEKARADVAALTARETTLRKALDDYMTKLDLQ